MSRLLATIYFGFYFLVFGSMALSHRLLSQVRPAFIHFNRDLTELALLATGLPRWMIVHPGSFIVFDVLLFALPLVWLATGLRRWLGVFFVGYLAVYLLLADLFWQVHHEPYILYLLLPLALITRQPERFEVILRVGRYYFLYIFVSAAIWKLARGAAFNGEEMSRILLIHHSELLSGDCRGWLCGLYSWLIDHPLAAQTLYWGGILTEAAFLLGLFTRRYDRLLIALAVLFVAADWWVMRIPYWPVLLGGVTLWLDTRPRQRHIVIYETTHHENLPALLDLCELRFPRVTVFLKEVSYHNLDGTGLHRERWPKTQFIVQREDDSNRRFIATLFRFLRTARCSHLHLATLDNNLLLWAVRLWAAPEVQVSMTVHEVNEYFTRPLATLREVTETLAKPILRGRIRHYHFFLPAMAERFRKKMPDATTVFLPSRFYAAAAPPPARETRPFTVVVPGSVNPNRRNYEPVLEVLRRWPAGTPPVQLVLLGDSSGEFGRHLVAQFQSITAVRVYEGYIPESIYEKEIREADVLWSPLRIHKSGSRDNPEIYGETTASGLTADILLNNIPALVPAELVLPAPFSAALLPYRDAGEAAQHLHRLVTDAAGDHRLRKTIHEAFGGIVAGNFTAAFEALTALDREGENGSHHSVKPVYPHIQ